MRKEGIGLLRSLSADWFQYFPTVSNSEYRMTTLTYFDILLTIEVHNSFYRYPFEDEILVLPGRSVLVLHSRYIQLRDQFAQRVYVGLITMIEKSLHADLQDFLGLIYQTWPVGGKWMGIGRDKRTEEPWRRKYRRIGKVPLEHI